MIRKEAGVIKIFAMLLFESLLSLNLDEQNKFTEIYNTYKNLMYHIAYDIIKDVDKSEDIVEEAFLRIIEHLNEVEDVTSKKTKNWIAIIVKNLAIDSYRRKKREIPLEDVEEVPTSEEGILVKDEYDMKKLIAKLPSHHRDMLYLTYIHKHNYGEIAKELGISKEAAQKRVSRAKLAILALMKE